MREKKRKVRVGCVANDCRRPSDCSIKMRVLRYDNWGWLTITALLLLTCGLITAVTCTMQSHSRFGVRDTEELQLFEGKDASDTAARQKRQSNSRFGVKDSEEWKVFSDDSRISKRAVEDMTYSRSGSPYVITSDINVGVGETMIVDAGVTMRFSSGVGINVRGTLIAEVSFVAVKNVKKTY